MNDFTLNDGSCHLNIKGCRRNSCLKLSTFDWLCDLPETAKETNLVEVQFKNTRKAYFLNADDLPLEKGTMVAVEASPGHDIGEVTLTGKLVLLQMKKNRIDTSRYELKKIYRIARDIDIQKYEESKAKEHDTMVKACQIAASLGLNMKIGDVEYQGDGTKAIFYYIADDRVDFRQLIRVYAETFRVRIEMKQIGARQEAGRIGGTGPCGRELCCASWMSSFCSVTTSAARIQDISLNPQKLAGLCAKLKCCLNYELDMYQEANRDLPDRDVTLETQNGNYYFFKADALKGEVIYSKAPNAIEGLEMISSERAKEVIAMNRRGEIPESLGGTSTTAADIKIDYENVVGQDDLTRFDKAKKHKSGKRGGNNQKKNEPKAEQPKDNTHNNTRRPKPNGKRPNSQNKAEK